MENKIKVSSLSKDAITEMLSQLSNARRHHEVESIMSENSDVVKEHHAERKDVCQYLIQKLEKAYEKVQRSNSTCQEQSAIRFD